MPERQPLALVVDDEPDICDLLSMTLHRMKVRADIAMSVAEASRRLQEKQYDFCLTDMKLPDGDGLQLVEEIQRRAPDRALPVAVLTAHGNMDTAITALKLGAFDFVSKPVNLERLRSLVQLALKLRQENTAPPAEFPAALLGQSSAIQNLRAQIEKVAHSNAPILVYGESGSGKELTARTIHSRSPRAERPFITATCSTIPQEQLDAVLFGSREPGEIKTGLIEQANGGSLLLEDITELPLDIQLKLLQALQEKCVRPVNSADEIPFDTRILSTTSTLLAHEVSSGRFRSDLYYRISVIELAVPALRNRPEDIPLLARSTMRGIAARTGHPTPRISQEALAALQGYPFPGNLPQLENILERAHVLCDSNTIKAEHLQLDSYACSATADDAQHNAAVSPETSRYTPVIHPEKLTISPINSLDELLENIERQSIEDALAETGWNKTAAAEKLGITFRSLRYRLKKLGLEA
ncbi:sigma-54-dependent transcriptional regulator [Microbulbifer sp. SA54]|uniref:sigma-54-dependent transcriptional regulator n=1 Tax=Microbulbifer sp. SA54 TaxID=3401577 RepID=UPI003AB092A7